MNGSPKDQINLYQQFFCSKLVNTVKENMHYDIRLTVVMVNLRNDERFFANNNNVLPGTLINEGVVSPDYDFFIVSQTSRGGTVVPNHYKVIHCDSKLE